MRKKIISVIIFFSLSMFTTTINAGKYQLEHSGYGIKCGTPQIMRNILLGTAKISARPEMDTSAVSSQNHFRVHYNTSGIDAPDLTDADKNGLPDYVDSTLVYLEYAWDLMVNQLGYLPPLSDEGKGGGDEVDVYLEDLGDYYGLTTPEKYFKTSTPAYISIDKDFSDYWFATKGYAALRVTTAHEFFHTIHFRYLNKQTDILWWMEHTAVWMEDRAWDDVNDYLAYLSYFFEQFYPLDHTGGFFMYGATIWAHYLAKRFGDDIIRDIWEHLSEHQTAEIAAFDDVIPIGLPGAFAEFSIWNYFTEHRANTTDFYKDSNLFKEHITSDISINKSTALDTLSTKKLTSRYVEILLAGVSGEDHALGVHVTPLDGGKYINSLIFYNNPFDYRIHIVEPDGEEIPLEKNWEKVILVTSCTNTNGQTYNYLFETAITECCPGVEEEPLYAFLVHGTFPNPFNPLTTVSFTLPESGTVSIQVYNAIGQKVEDLFEGFLDAGEKQLVWKPSHLSGGVYLIHIKTPLGSKTTKTLFLK